jgi:arsenate reductase
VRAPPSRRDAARRRRVHRRGVLVHVVDVVREPGLASAAPKRLTAELAAGASLLVTMGCGDACPAVPGLRRDDWPLEDPKGKPVARVREIRDEIRERVRALVAAEGVARA